MAISHSLPRRIGPSTADDGSARPPSADFHSLAIPLAIAVSVVGALSTRSSAVIQKVFVPGGGSIASAERLAADAACRLATESRLCKGGAILFT